MDKNLFDTKISSFVINMRNIRKNTTGTTCGAGTTYLFGAHEFTPGF
jgi:hypothetical protein